MRNTIARVCREPGPRGRPGTGAGPSELAAARQARYSMTVIWLSR